ncbi:thioredoxin family protein [Oleisolibacter albus]|uniref:thioredoxin family protein n=1 Tax=Oleisolibacter albus TaxID=2171757 RepID=UPI000DF1F1D3|nr:thioredoxin family protein [Oleisolibacter albus]
MAAQTPLCDFGWKARDFRLTGTDGRQYGLEDVRGPAGLLVMFICNHCPYVKAVIDRLVQTTGQLAQAGIGSIAIMSNDTERYPDDSFENMARFAAEHRFGFPYVIDADQAVARTYGAVCTPDFFGFNADLELQYRGRLDASRVQPVPDAEPELLNAMLKVARTGRGPVDQIASMGCSIKWREGV